MLGLRCHTGFLVAVSRGCSLDVVRGLLIVEASLATEHGPWSTDSIVGAHGLCRRRKWQPTPVFLPTESRAQRSLVGCCPWGLTESDTTEATQHACMHWRRKWQPTPVFLPRESLGQRSLVGCHLWGHTESDTTEVTYQQQQHSQIQKIGQSF